MSSDILNIREQCIRFVDLISRIFAVYDAGIGNENLYVCYVDTDELDHDFCGLREFDERVRRWFGDALLLKKSWYVLVYFGEIEVKMLIVSTERRRDNLLKGYYCDFKYAAGVGHSCELLHDGWGNCYGGNMRFCFDFILEWSWNNIFGRHLCASYYYGGRRKLDELFDKGCEG